MEEIIIGGLSYPELTLAPIVPLNVSTECTWI